MAERKPRVAIFSPALDAVSGVSTHALLLFASRLAEHYELRHFQVGSEGRTENTLQRALRLFVGPLQLAWFLVSRRIRMVHLNTSLDRKAFWRDLAFLAVAKAVGCKVLNQIHGGALPEQFFDGDARRTAILRWFVRASDAVVVLSLEELAAYRAFAPDTRVEHIPNAIDVQQFRPPAERVNRDRPLRLVYIGRLIREKGMFEALEAFAALRHAGRKLLFDVAGTGRDAEAMREHARRLGVDSHVRFLGPVFGADKVALWHRSDVLVFPTYSLEGLPYALLEAMASGCVPVISVMGAMGEAVMHGKQALIVPARDPQRLAEAVALLDADRRMLEALSVRAQLRAGERYSLERLGGEFLRLYCELLPT